MLDAISENISKGVSHYEMEDVFLNLNRSKTVWGANRQICQEHVNDKIKMQAILN